MAQPRTARIVTIDGRADEERTTNENMSANRTKEDMPANWMKEDMSANWMKEGMSAYWMKEYRPVEPMDDERSVKSTDERVAGGKAVVAKPSPPATAKVSPPATAKVSPPATAEPMATTKAHQRRCRGMRESDRRKGRRAYPVFRVR